MNYIDAPRLAAMAAAAKAKREQAARHVRSVERARKATS